MAFPIPSKRRAEKAKRPKSGVPYNKDTIAELLLKYNGNVSCVADALGACRHGVDNCIKNDPHLSEMLKQCRERWLDRIEASVFQRAEEGTDTALQTFILKTQGRHRGWDTMECQNTAKDIASAAFAFILDKSKNPAEHKA